MGVGRLATAFAVFFSGIAVIVATVLVVYVFTIMADRLTCFDAAVLTEEELEERRNATPVTIQSGLAGLLKEERNRIYRSFFEKRSFPYHKVNNDHGKETNHGVVDLEVQPTQNIEEQRTIERDVATKEFEDTIPVDTTVEPCTPTCSICLNEYDDGDKVILGTACSHMFHYDCCMQWVDKGNEHCPYCRENMISPTDFCNSAIEVVGDERVTKLKTINQSAAVRVAALAASGTQTISHPVPPMGQSLDVAAGNVVVVVATSGPTDLNTQYRQQDLTEDSLIHPAVDTNDATDLGSP